MESIYIHTEHVDGIGKVEFLSIPMIELSPIYRATISMIVSAGVSIDGIDSDLSKVIELIEDDRFEKIRNTLFKYMVVNDTNLWKGYESILKDNVLLEVPLFALAVKVYLGKLLTQALKSDSAARKAVVSIFPQVETVLTGFSGIPLSEEKQPSQK